LEPAIVGNEGHFVDQRGGRDHPVERIADLATGQPTNSPRDRRVNRHDLETRASRVQHCVHRINVSFSQDAFSAR
jgi:hypothetical protein